METYDFKTTMKCDGCVAKITPGMNAISGIDSWSVDMSEGIKMLHVKAERDIEWPVIALLKDKGYSSELVNKA